MPLASCSSLLAFRRALEVFGFLAYFFLLISSFTPCNNQYRTISDYLKDQIPGGIRISTHRGWAGWN